MGGRSSRLLTINATSAFPKFCLVVAIFKRDHSLNESIKCLVCHSRCELCISMVEANILCPNGIPKSTSSAYITPMLAQTNHLNDFGCPQNT